MADLATIKTARRVNPALTALCDKFGEDCFGTLVHKHLVNRTQEWDFDDDTDYDIIAECTHAREVNGRLYVWMMPKGYAMDDNREDWFVYRDGAFTALDGLDSVEFPSPKI